MNSDVTHNRPMTGGVDTGSIGERASRLWLAAIVAAGTLLRLATLNTRSLWVDEIVSVDQAAQPVKDVIITMASGVHPPQFHLMMHFWMRAFGASEVSIRSFSVMWGIAAIPIAWWAAKAYLGKRGALYAAGIVAVSPYFIWYAQEARMYSMMFVYGLLSTGFLGRALASNRRKDWVGYSLTTFLGLFTHYFFPFLVIGQVGYYLFRELYVEEHEKIATGVARLSWRRPLGVFTDIPTLPGWMWSMLFIGTTYSMWLFRSMFMPDLSDGGVLAASATGAGLGYGQAAPSLAFRFNDSIMTLVQMVAGFHPSWLTYALVAMWPLLVYLSMALLDYTRPGKKLILALLWASMGIGIIVAAGQWQGQVLAPRYFSAVAAPAVILTAHVFELISARARRIIFAVGVAACVALWLNQSYNPDNMVRFDNRQAFQQVMSDYETGDVLIYEPFYLDVVIDYYLPDSVPAFGFPEYGQFAKLRNGKKELGEDLFRVIGPSRRVWLLLSFQDIEQLRGDAYNTRMWFLRNGYRIAQNHQYNRVQLILFERVEDTGGYDILTGR